MGNQQRLVTSGFGFIETIKQVVEVIRRRIRGGSSHRSRREELEMMTSARLISINEMIPGYPVKGHQRRMIRESRIKIVAKRLGDTLGATRVFAERIKIVLSRKRNDN